MDEPRLNSTLLVVLQRTEKTTGPTSEEVERRHCKTYVPDTQDDPGSEFGGPIRVRLNGGLHQGKELGWVILNLAIDLNPSATSPSLHDLRVVDARDFTYIQLDVLVTLFDQEIEDFSELWDWLNWLGLGPDVSGRCGSAAASSCR